MFSYRDALAACASQSVNDVNISHVHVNAAGTANGRFMSASTILKLE